jgi:hypothetical protein
LKRGNEFEKIVGADVSVNQKDDLTKAVNVQNDHEVRNVVEDRDSREMR